KCNKLEGALFIARDQSNSVEILAHQASKIEALKIERDVVSNKREGYLVDAHH
ncbi:hypothetical protein HAX54_036507, partial [Datura stramonium]|nr:hypothetical protein [Datura stramonium]